MNSYFLYAVQQLYTHGLKKIYEFILVCSYLKCI